ncbi:MAG: hypothetical protein HKP27_12995, partial [Myxococcales bacterium]|nr:hypothetical protein [Myxococcales bacterium]
DWTADAIPGAQVVAAPDGARSLRVASTSPDGITQRLATIEQPAVSQPGYALVGRIRHRGVVGDGYLEMWSHFSDGGRYFSRTLGRGRLAALRGDADWREFELPFFLQGASPPSKIELNLVLPGEGEVWLGPARLVPFGPAAAGSGTADWWSDHHGGWIGAIGGSLLGALGAIVGVLAALGRGRTFVLAAVYGALVSGVVVFAVGAYAWWNGQSYGVWYPLVLIGLLCAVIDGALIPSVRRRYEEVELRRISARDAQPSAP